MGVDYYHCESCDESRYEEYVGNCQACGNNLCTYCLVNKEHDSRYAYEHGLRYDSTKPELMKQYEESGFNLNDKDGKCYYKDGDIIDDSGIQSKFCPFCTGKQVDRDAVLEYLLEKYNVKIEDVWKEMNK